jgi:hypothetical protein
LLQSTSEPYYPYYVYRYLGRSAPSGSPAATLAAPVRLLAAQKLMQMGWQPQNTSPHMRQLTVLRRVPQMQVVVDPHEELMRAVRDQEREQLRQLARLAAVRQDARQALLTADPRALADRLKEVDRGRRLEAVWAIGVRRLHLEDALIDRLSDRDAEVRRAAHAALVVLARGTDFGPDPEADRGGRRRAADRWRRWLTLQDRERGGLSVPEPPAAVAESPGDKAAVGRSLSRAASELATVSIASERALRAFVLDDLDAATAARCLEFISAGPDREDELLQRLRTGEGLDEARALAVALPYLADGFRGRAETALVERLARLKREDLREQLRSPQEGLRRAAALACARADGGRAFVGDLVGVLADAEPGVVQAARSALRQITQEDFGPSPEATRVECEVSRSAWEGWWLKQQGKVFARRKGGHKARQAQGG